MRNFSFNGLPSRVVFGAGSLGRLESELDALGASRPLVLATPGQEGLARMLAQRLGTRCAGVFAGAAMHVPAEVARQACAEAARLQADCAIAIGGGSTIGLGKAIALESALPVLAIPTTYSGSEMTPIYGITEAGLKRTGRDLRVLPRTVIYDPELSTGLRWSITVTSALNAIAHAAEGLYARDGNPVMDLMAQEGIRALYGAIGRLRDAPTDLEARGDALYGAWLCGSVLGSVGMALHHKLCHTLGGSFELPHAEVHTVVLPHALAFNAAAAPEAMRRIAAAVGAGAPEAAPAALYELARANGAPVSLRAIGMREQDLDRAAGLAVANPYWNPRPIDAAARDDLRALLQRAYEGAPPG